MKRLLWLAMIVSVVTYLFWGLFPEGSFYIGNGLFVFLLTIVLFYQNRSWFITFFLMCLAGNNLLDELFFDNTVLSWNELLLIIVVPAIWLYKTRNDRKAKLF